MLTILLRTTFFANPFLFRAPIPFPGRWPYDFRVEMSNNYVKGRPSDENKNEEEEQEEKGEEEDGGEEKEEEESFIT